MLHYAVKISDTFILLHLSVSIIVLNFHYFTVH